MSYGDEIKPSQAEIDVFFGPFLGSKRRTAPTGIPLTRTTGQTNFPRRRERIASPGVLEDVRYWWGKLPWWGKALGVGGPAVLFLALAARKTEELKKL